MRSETHSAMHLHLSLPDGFADEAAFLTSGPLTETSTESNGEGDGDGDSNGGSLFATFLPLILIFAVVYFLLLRPRQKAARQQRELQSQLEVGDEIMLTSGMYGFVTGIESASDVVWVEIDDDVQIRVSRRAISGKVDTSGAPSAGPADSATSTSESARDVGAPKRPTLRGGGKPASTSGAQDSTDSTESDELADE